MTVYITKRALTQGIVVSDEFEDCSDTSPGMIGRRNWISRGGEYYHRGEWFPTLAEAQTRAEEMRATKIRALRRQLNTVENRCIPVTPDPHAT